MKKSKAMDVSNFTAEILNVALEMSLEWGPNWLSPINGRIKSRYPELTEEQANDLNLWCVEVSRYAYKLIEMDYPLVMFKGEEGTGIEQVQQKYPQINEENLGRLYNQGMYYAWHG